MDLDGADFQLMLVSLVVALLKVMNKCLTRTFQRRYVVVSELGLNCSLRQVPILKKDYSVIFWKVGYLWDMI